ncbi:hypothetical protein [Eudoraea sp.]|uniref:hypothetical protein n=1 Tax=Eudoraea sp. TaxID=1979955 RepID=UPI003C744DF2
MLKVPLKLPEDIVDYVSRNYAEEEIPIVMAALGNAKLHDGRDPDFRMLRCALVGSNNSIEGIENLVSLLAVDYRDVIVAGEYADKDGELVQVRDLSLPISSDGQ